MKKYSWICPWLMVAVWTALIFYMGSQSGETSADLSGAISESIARAATRFNIDVTVDTVHSFARTSAHFFIYFVLGMFWILALFKHTSALRMLWYIAFFAILLTALVDEGVQVTVPGRAGTWFDVFIDTAGGCVGIAFAILVKKGISAPESA